MFSTIEQIKGTSNIVPTFESVDEILWCDHSNETSSISNTFELFNSVFNNILLYSLFNNISVYSLFNNNYLIVLIV